MKVKLELTDEEKKQYGLPVSERWFVTKDVSARAVGELVNRSKVIFDAGEEA